MMTHGRSNARSVLTVVAILVTVLSLPLMLDAATSNSGSDGAEESSPSTYEQAMEQVEAEEYEQAIDLFEQVLEEDEENPEAHNMLGYSYRQTGNFSDSIRHYRRALELKPEFPQAREYLGQTYLQAALDQLNKLESSQQEDADRYEQSLREAILEHADRLQSGGATVASTEKVQPTY